MLASFYYHFRKITWHLRVVHLMLITLIMTGAGVIAATEKVSFGKAVYFSFITGLTVGYGDIVPQTAIGQVISVLLALVGMLFSGLVVAAAVEGTRRAWEETESQTSQNQA